MLKEVRAHPHAPHSAQVSGLVSGVACSSHRRLCAVQCTWDVTRARGLYFKRAAPRSAEQPFSGRDAVQCAVALLFAILLFAGWMAVLGSGYFGDAPPYRLRRDMF